MSAIAVSEASAATGRLVHWNLGLFAFSTDVSTIS